MIGELLYLFILLFTYLHYCSWKFQICGNFVTNFRVIAKKPWAYVIHKPTLYGNLKV